MSERIEEKVHLVKYKARGMEVYVTATNTSLLDAHSQIDALHIAKALNMMDDSEEKLQSIQAHTGEELIWEVLNPSPTYPWRTAHCGGCGYCRRGQPDSINWGLCRRNAFGQVAEGVLGEVSLDDPACPNYNPREETK